jgi:hypothetical protein
MYVHEGGSNFLVSLINVKSIFKFIKTLHIFIHSLILESLATKVKINKI